MQQIFQVNLRGVIELLSNHLYSGPQVYVRELLQNAVDALTARAELRDPSGGDASTWGVRISAFSRDGVPSIRFEDDGVGLTEAEVHRFLATLGESSKRRVGESAGPAEADLLGQFGIGLLACFLVTDEILVTSRSARDPGAPAVEWRGRQDGTYSVRVLPDDLRTGTTVELTARSDRHEWFDAERVQMLLQHFGSLLRWPIALESKGATQLVNDRAPPWRADHTDVGAFTRDAMDYGQHLFGMRFLDFIPLASGHGGAEGIAYVLPFAATLASPRAHRVHLKGMLVSDKSTELVPPWAFFVQCVVDARSVRPTASREALFEDATLDATRREIGDGIRAWLMQLARTEPKRLLTIIAVHHRAIKALAAEDDDVLALFADSLPFETTSGTLSFGEIRRVGTTIAYAHSVDTFRQMAPVASAQGRLLVNAGFAYDEDVLVRLCAAADVGCERLDSATLTETLDDLSVADQRRAATLVETAERVLGPYGCDVSVKAFHPIELPAFYASSDDADFKRQLEKTQARSKGVWSAMLGSIARSAPHDDRPLLCLNYRHPLIRRLADIDDVRALELSVSMLYVHALLLGHRPLRAHEHQFLPTSILGFIEWGLGSRREEFLQ